MIQEIIVGALILITVLLIHLVIKLIIITRLKANERNIIPITNNRLISKIKNINELIKMQNTCIMLIIANLILIYSLLALNYYLY